jgi:hypothetical protein
VETSDDVPSHSGQEMDYQLAEEERGFVYWLKSGFAFTLPIQVISLVALLIYIWTATSAN